MTFLDKLNWIKDGQDVLALFIPGSILPENTTFLTPQDYNQQVGFIVYKQNEFIIPHDHKKVERKITGTSEILLIKKGKVEAQIFNKKRVFVCSVILTPGDLLVLVDGGHGFKMLEDSVMVEVKQGPYLNMDDKVRFNWSENDPCK